MKSALYKLAAVSGSPELKWNDHHLKVVARLDDNDIETLQLPSAVRLLHDTIDCSVVNPSTSPPLWRLGVCAMEDKALSKPNQDLFHCLEAKGDIEVDLFGNDVLLNKSVDEWPICDFLIAFYSDGFPLDKAISYTRLRSPISCNDLLLQRLLFDRRLCHQVLNLLKIRTPKRLEVNRDGGPQVGHQLAQHVYDSVGLNLPSYRGGNKPLPAPTVSLSMDGNTLLVDEQKLHKPFVEKPVSAEDHNIYIYFPSTSKEGGGGRRLFRKIGDKCSEYDPDLIIPRCITEQETMNSYVYEPLLTADHGQDVKAYAVGPRYCLAVTRKSPAVTGMVHQNANGKEMRQITEVSKEEAEAAAKISVGFGQAVCGFDIVRSGGKSYVIDVNGWTSVKNQPGFYGECAEILRQTLIARQYNDRSHDRRAPSDGFQG